MCPIKYAPFRISRTSASFPLSAHDVALAEAASIVSAYSSATLAVASASSFASVVVTRHSDVGAASISGYSVQKGALDLLTPGGKTGTTGAGATDVAITENSQFLYSLNGGAHTITGFGVSQSNGSLDANGAVSVPTGAVGLAAK